MLYLAVVVLITTAVPAIFCLAVGASLRPDTTVDGLELSATYMPLLPSNLNLLLLCLLSGSLFVSSVLGYIWYRVTSSKIERPIKTISHALDQLSKGRLDETVVVHNPDEFRQIGASMNELAANLQELLLYVWKQTGICLALLNSLQTNQDLRHNRYVTNDALGDLKKLTQSMDDLRQLAKSYVFFDVSLNDNKTHAIIEPGTTASPMP